MPKDIVISSSGITKTIALEHPSLLWKSYKGLSGKTELKAIPDEGGSSEDVFFATVVTSDDRCLLAVVYEETADVTRAAVVIAAVDCAKLIDELARAIRHRMLDCGGPTVYAFGSRFTAEELSRMASAGVGVVDVAEPRAIEESVSRWAKRLRDGYVSGLTPRPLTSGQLPEADGRYNRMPDGVTQDDVVKMVQYLSNYGEPL